MKLALDVAKDLAVWEPSIRHQLDLNVMPIRQNLRSLNLSFEREYKRRKVAGIFRCEIVAQGISGRFYRATALHSDGLTSIADACTRIRRSLVRDRLMSSALRRARVAKGESPSSPYPLSATPRGA